MTRKTRMTMRKIGAMAWPYLSVRGQHHQRPDQDDHDHDHDDAQRDHRRPPPPQPPPRPVPRRQSNRPFMCG